MINFSLFIDQMPHFMTCKNAYSDALEANFGVKSFGSGVVNIYN